VGGALLGILGGGVLPSSPNPDPVSDQKMSFFTPVFRPVLSKIHTCFQALLRNSFRLNGFESYYKFTREKSD